MLESSAQRPQSEAGRVLVCTSGELAERGRGVRFAVASRTGRPNQRLTGFVVRFQGSVHGYLNQCAHVATELDWREGEFFDHSGLYLICATHGAVYEPESGHCVGGPCRGARLQALCVLEHDGMVYWLPDDAFIAPP
ncbi:MAG: Rieske 2Fe-2S domain-containing protein [Burkholderiaceae bacterium]|jgi:nitrite reductase/ring-hydroxylating ferredoxin subunit